MITSVGNDGKRSLFRTARSSIIQMSRMPCCSVKQVSFLFCDWLAWEAIAIPSLTSLCLNFPIVLLNKTWLAFCLVLLIAEFRVWTFIWEKLSEKPSDQDISYPLPLARRARSPPEIRRLRRNNPKDRFDKNGERRWFRRNNSRCRRDENLTVASTVMICSGWWYEYDVVACGWKEGIKLKGGRKETVQKALLAYSRGKKLLLALETDSFIIPYLLRVSRISSYSVSF